jgi:hypothetical protein
VLSWLGIVEKISVASQATDEFVTIVDCDYALACEASLGPYEHHPGSAGVRPLHRNQIVFLETMQRWRAAARGYHKKDADYGNTRGKRRHMYLSKTR